MSDATGSTAAVTDHRTPPRGVLPRHLQMWLMVGLAIGILGIIAFAGHPEPAPPAAVGTHVESQAPSPDRLRDYQDRLRVLDVRTRQAALLETHTAPPASRPVFEDVSGGASSPDPLESERQRREYESLFASNVVMSRRPDAQRFVADRPSATDVAARTRDEGLPAPPSLDEVADAVMRATTKYGAPPQRPVLSKTRPTLRRARRIPVLREAQRDLHRRVRFRQPVPRTGSSKVRSSTRC